MLEATGCKNSSSYLTYVLACIGVDLHVSPYIDCNPFLLFSFTFPLSYISHYLFFFLPNSSDTYAGFIVAAFFAGRILGRLGNVMACSASELCAHNLRDVEIVGMYMS